MGVKGLGGHERAYGSTLLHMDLTSAINWSKWSENGQDGCRGAHWVLFARDQKSGLREFLGATPGKEDPIHSQTNYLDSEQLLRLETEKSIVPYQHVQEEDEAIVIPAGCAHQVSCVTRLSAPKLKCNRPSFKVRNHGHCMKIAVDFISGDMESLKACQELASEFRELNMVRRGGEDVLEFGRHILFSILSFRTYFDNIDWAGDPQQILSKSLRNLKRKANSTHDDAVRCPRCSKKSHRKFLPDALAQHMYVYSCFVSVVF